MTAALWLILGLITWLAVVAVVLAFARGAHTEDSDAQEAVNSCRAALHECEPTVRRVRAGS